MSTHKPRPSKYPRRPPLVLMGLCAMVGIVGAIVWALLQEPAPLGMLRLADGSVVRLEAVTVGPKQRFVGGARWRRLLAPLVMDGPLSRLVGPIHTYPFGGQNSGEMVFWTVSRPAPERYLGTQPAVVFDEHGCRFPTNEVFEPPDGNEQVTMRVAQAVPRRGPWIGVRLQSFGNGGEAARAAEFRVPNPAQGPYPVWKPQPLPITRLDGPLAITLAALTTGAEGPGPPLRPAAAGHVRWSRASFRLTEGGRRADEWNHQMLLTFSDATGNRFYPQGGNQYQLGGMTHVAFEGGLCAEEPAWKLRVEFARTSHIAPADLWTVRGVPVTKQGRLTRSFAWTTRHGVRVKLVGIPQTAAQAPPGVIDIGVGGLPAALLQTSEPLKGLWLALVRARDDRGRELMTRPTLGSYGAYQYGFSLETFADTQRVDLTFALARSRSAEFVAKPSRVGAR